MYHKPVLLQACLDGLNIRPNGTYVDVTFGGGGHSKAILEKLGPNGKLIGFDQDSDALKNDLNDPRFTLIHSNFRFIGNHLEYLKVLPIDGILADLGVSSHQFDQASRGFSIRMDGPLDMRMDQSANHSAFDFINKASKEDLIETFKEFGEIFNAGKVASLIVSHRTKEPIESTLTLTALVEKLVHPKDRNKFLAQIFQAIRIKVNAEMEVLKNLLEISPSLLGPGGRLVFISYHSLEDRMVKNFIKTGNTKGLETKDVFGNTQSPFKNLTTKPIVPEEIELEQNNRSRSAKLRIAEKK
ncbi:MAG: 16S rRNA (cytosine(1402)-N(4))-methyltransferase RsmH [Bacteroidia bacterium]|nr:16S rRNA (cytosine(1402)-N(4))-methyltransferase RsmH [Bacteroidia bacterium]